MEKLQGEVKDIRGGRSVQEVLAQSTELSHNFREVIVLGIDHQSRVTMRRTRMNVADLALLTAILQANLNDEILDIT